MNCPENQYICFYPTHPGGFQGGGVGGQNFKSPGNVMNCPENQYNLFLPIPPWGGVPGGGGVGVQISKVR